MYFTDNAIVFIQTYEKIKSPPHDQPIHPHGIRSLTTHQTSSSNIPSNSSLPNGTLNLSVPIASFLASTI